MRIAISGKSGCGNTTVSTLVAEKLGFRLINFTFRNLATEKGLDFWELSRLAEEDDSIDRELDRRQVEMALSESNCVLGSRLAIWMLKEADFKVYLDASAEVRAQRILRREGGSYAERLQETKDRDERDSARYLRLYQIDNSDSSVADMIIDTETKTPAEIATLIVEAVGAIESSN